MPTVPDATPAAPAPTTTVEPQEPLVEDDRELLEDDLLVEDVEELTLREREVVALVALVLPNDKIAEQLGMSPATAKTRVSRSMVKLHVRDRAKLVALAYQAGCAKPRGDRGPGGEAGRLGARVVAAGRDGRLGGPRPDPRRLEIRPAGCWPARGLNNCPQGGCR
jgi:DNA-binding CsgD family transcriptional regulator